MYWTTFSLPTSSSLAILTPLCTLKPVCFQPTPGTPSINPIVVRKHIADGEQDKEYFPLSDRQIESPFWHGRTGKTIFLGRKMIE